MTGPRRDGMKTRMPRSNVSYASQTGGGAGGNTRPSIRRCVLGPKQGIRGVMSTWSLGETTHARQMGTESTKAPVAMTEVLMPVSTVWVVVVVAEVTTGASMWTGEGLTLSRIPAMLIALNTPLIQTTTTTRGRAGRSELCVRLTSSGIAGQPPRRGRRVALMPATRETITKLTAMLMPHKLSPAARKACVTPGARLARAKWIRSRPTTSASPWCAIQVSQAGAGEGRRRVVRVQLTRRSLPHRQAREALKSFRMSRQRDVASVPNASLLLLFPRCVKERVRERGEGVGHLKCLSAPLVSTL
jgi:hypothetical protein